MLDIDSYQEFAVSKMSKDLTKKEELATLALGIAGEGGEVADHVKKHIGHGHDLDEEHLVKELGDVLWYVATMADHLGIKLSDVAHRNIEKLSNRYPKGFTIEDSKNRKDK